MSRKISQRRNFSRFTRVYILLHTQSSYPNDCPYCLTRGRGFAFHPFHSTQWLVEWVAVLLTLVSFENNQLKTNYPERQHRWDTHTNSINTDKINLSIMFQPFLRDPVPVPYRRNP